MEVLEKMAHEEGSHPKEEPVPDFEKALSNLSNPELLSALDLALLELEKRLFRYAKVGPELLEMADEGLVLAARARYRPIARRPCTRACFLSDTQGRETKGCDLHSRGFRQRACGQVGCIGLRQIKVTVSKTED